MNAPKRLFGLSLLGLATALFLPGCVTSPPVAREFVGMKEGTVLVYHRKSSGSYGTFNDQVTWLNSLGTWQGQPAMTAASAQAGTQVYDSKTHGLVAMLGRDGKPAVSYDPPIAYRWPMKVGDSWSSQHKVTLHANGRTVPLTLNYKVEAYDRITVPAGTFNAYLVVSTDSNGEVQRVWIAPADSLSVVKRTLDRPATHPQGAGHLEGELLSRKLP
jgi:hypothetical protein